VDQEGNIVNIENNVTLKVEPVDNSLARIAGSTQFYSENGMIST